MNVFYFVSKKDVKRYLVELPQGRAFFDIEDNRVFKDFASVIDEVSLIES